MYKITSIHGMNIVHKSKLKRIFVNHFFFIMILLLASGCSGFGQVVEITDLTVEQLRLLNNISIYSQPTDLKYTSLGRIKGLSCRASGSDASEADAITQLKINAIKINANTIFYPTCSHKPGTDWGNNCWASWTCVGEAALIK